MEILKLENVTKRFGGLVAVNKVSFSIEKGEAIGIVGPNGSGKTTLYNLINGVYIPDEGKIFFEGQDITNLPIHTRAHLGIARTFQIPRPFNSATVRENVAVGAMFGYAKASVDEALAIADDYLKVVGLYDKRDAPAGKLTPLEKRLMEVARALAMKPKLLLLDEVMAGMNPSDIDRLINLLKRIREEEDISIVSMVEHLMHAITKFAERVIVMHQGSKLLEGETIKVLNDPRVVEVYLGKKLES
ncbi:amino acid/amide ABC transporter ATP-binding protein 1, HAAT family [Archaeoglobus sulfaticallidus PM70-1]|uniref:Amino acid/amide ABC transporter ATP-binding protein 1, HAAT family n=1 Tax=Archaeoglobus sulfaticallidus PM70-1 TaxID=387631 RepID=N0BFM1_9EURY|nr:ABC transporter ATP-binding protein [Archaeoglobus sulfaticallidus]AGK61828.1 amino acid/amide ABC transporter ATP-binding protein 1, HAAT family [Archaeoglobus sulfaticallidus PM70-1]